MEKKNKQNCLILRIENPCKYGSQNTLFKKALNLSLDLPYFKSQFSNTDCFAAVTFSPGIAYSVQCYKTHPNCSTAVNTKVNVKVFNA